MSFIKDLWGYFRTRGAWWLAPVILALLLIGVLLVLEGFGALQPFIYTLF